MIQPLPRSFLISRKQCCDNGCFNCPYKLACDKCHQINKISFQADGFICWNCGQGSIFTSDFYCQRTEANSLHFEDGQKLGDTV